MELKCCFRQGDVGVAAWTSPGTRHVSMNADSAADEEVQFFPRILSGHVESCDGGTWSMNRYGRGEIHTTWCVLLPRLDDGRWGVYR
jgi:hypothetical protein